MSTMADDILIRLRRLYDETGLSLLDDAMTEIAANRVAVAMYETILRGEADGVASAPVSSMADGGRTGDA